MPSLSPPPFITRASSRAPQRTRLGEAGSVFQGGTRPEQAAREPDPVAEVGLPAASKWRIARPGPGRRTDQCTAAWRPRSSAGRSQTLITRSSSCLTSLMCGGRRSRADGRRAPEAGRSRRGRRRPGWCRSDTARTLMARRHSAAAGARRAEFAGDNEHSTCPRRPGRRCGVHSDVKGAWGYQPPGRCGGGRPQPGRGNNPRLLPQHVTGDACRAGWTSSHAGRYQLRRGRVYGLSQCFRDLQPAWVAEAAACHSDASQGLRACSVFIDSNLD